METNTKLPDYSGITKGNWSANKLGGTDGLNRRIESEDRRIIADCYSFSESIPNDEAEANAQAIANLPNLIQENEKLKAQCETYAKDYNNLVGEVERLSRSNCDLLEALKEVTTFLNVLPKLRLANKQGFDECINIDGVTILENQCNAAITKAQSNTI